MMIILCYFMVVIIIKNIIKKISLIFYPVLNRKFHLVRVTVEFGINAPRWMLQYLSLTCPDDMGFITDPMDKKADALLKTAWKAAVFNLKPVLATTCVARTLNISRLQACSDQNLRHS